MSGGKHKYPFGKWSRSSLANAASSYSCGRPINGVVIWIEAFCRIGRMCQTPRFAAHVVRMLRLAAAHGDIRLTTGQIDEIKVGGKGDLQSGMTVEQAWQPWNDQVVEERVEAGQAARMALDWVSLLLLPP